MSLWKQDNASFYLSSSRSIGKLALERLSKKIDLSTDRIGDTSCAWLCHLSFEGSPAVSSEVYTTSCGVVRLQRMTFQRSGRPIRWW
ncbi:hypothetical protein Krac_3975 [Ktedonobacter racemifer DSM 44963]|uniref:Uncharacterized protein n=1 Tax=Ktedonobacter racemifer DSM 44963 TaxID=485913 RepID=D6U3S1_KTERA|nr:hypothetical protein Krac_3975 [Ktedonobacter racemifer DSM 44963]